MTHEYPKTLAGRFEMVRSLYAARVRVKMIIPYEAFARLLEGRK